MKENKIILITGANIGIGKDTARQLALLDSTEKIYLACRNPQKAEAAKKDLIEITGRDIFEIVIMDVSDPDSVKAAAKLINEPIDAVILNAGGMGGKQPEALTEEGTTTIFATNVLGHVVLVDELVAAGKLNNVVLYAGSEAARGVKRMGMKRPAMKDSSAEEIATVIDGSYFGKKFDGMLAYGYTKYIAALWMSSMARKHKDIRFITMSPGGTNGTKVMDDMKGIQKFMFKYILMPVVLPAFGMAHKLEDGAKRFVDGITDTKFKSGVFYASKINALTGPMVDQSAYFPALNNTAFQDNANVAIHQFLSSAPKQTRVSQASAQ